MNVDHRLMTGCLEPIFKKNRNWKRVYFDLPGMGKTPAPYSFYNSDQMLKIILKFIRKIAGKKPFVLAGESYGAYLAKAITQKMPTQVRGLLLICPALNPIKETRILPRHTPTLCDPKFISKAKTKDMQDFLKMHVVQNFAVWNKYKKGDNERNGMVFSC
jgi:pimeloyl-ACP methyl ester carboxylesterase